MKKIKVRIQAEFTLFYDLKIKIDEEDYKKIKFNPSCEDEEMKLLLLKYCKNKTPTGYLLHDASVIQEAGPRAKEKKEILIEPVDKDHFQDMQSRAKYHGFTLEIKKNYVALTHGYSDSPEIKKWKNKEFNKMSPEVLKSFLISKLWI